MNSVVIKSIDRVKINQAVLQYSAKPAPGSLGDHPFIWFGSWVYGFPHPGSDVDLCLVISDTDLRPRDRASGYLPVGFPVGIDLMVYTQAEFHLSINSPLA